MRAPALRLPGLRILRLAVRWTIVVGAAGGFAAPESPARTRRGSVHAAVDAGWGCGGRGLGSSTSPRERRPPARAARRLPRRPLCSHSPPCTTGSVFRRRLRRTDHRGRVLDRHRRRRPAAPAVQRRRHHLLVALLDRKVDLNVYRSDHGHRPHRRRRRRPRPASDAECRANPSAKNSFGETAEAWRRRTATPPSSRSAGRLADCLNSEGIACRCAAAPPARAEGRVVRRVPVCKKWRNAGVHGRGEEGRGRRREVVLRGDGRARRQPGSSARGVDVQRRVECGV